MCNSPLIKMKDIHTDKDRFERWEFLNKKERNSIMNSVHLKTNIFLPCRVCNVCRKNKVNEWVQRLKYENKYWKYAYFITLTYRDKDRPNELIHNDIAKFIKKVRKYYDYYGLGKIKYFGAGEYGDKRGREHFHLILFINNDLPDLIPIKDKRKGIYYTSKFIADKWKNGFCVVAPALEGSFAYVAYYCVKSLSKRNRNLSLKKLDYFAHNYYDNFYNLYEKLENITIKEQREISRVLFNPEFKKPTYIFMSKKEPLGKRYIEDLDLSDIDLLIQKRIPKPLLNYLPSNIKEILLNARYEHLLNDLNENLFNKLNVMNVQKNKQKLKYYEKDLF